MRRVRVGLHNLIVGSCEAVVEGQTGVCRRVCQEIKIGRNIV